MTITRVYPRHLKVSWLNQEYLNNLKIERKIKDEYFFNHGRSALLFLLNNISKYKNKKLRVALQAFNCSSVLYAVLQSPSEPLLIDINLIDFSITLEELQAIKEIDVLLLLHYQGIPNQQYISIAEHCKNKKIILIDDLAQTENSYIDNTLVGTLSDYSIHSFSFDKPFTTFEGGSFRINKIDKGLKQLLVDNYYNLAEETYQKYAADLKALKYLYKYSTPKFYNKRTSDIGSVKLLSKISLLSNELLYKLLSFKIFFFFVYIFLKLSKSNKIKTLKLHDNKIKLILLQRKNYSDNNYSNDITNFLNINTEYNTENININRLSVIDSDHKIRDKMNALDYTIEAKNYNWGTPLHKRCPSCEKTSPLKNSEFASKSILNIPVWHNFLAPTI